MSRKYLFLFVNCLFIHVLSTAQNITTLTGTGTYGYSGDGGPATAALVEYVWHSVTDRAGNIYVTDNANHRVRKINPAGIITTVAGDGVPGFTGDGGAGTAARLLNPSGIVADGLGNVYFADAGNRRIRKLSTLGVITTIAGTGVAGSGGDGGAATAAQLNTPYGMMMDAQGNIYIADVGSSKVRRINTAGTIHTVAGNGLPGFSGDGGAATAAQLSSPGSVAMDIYGNLYIGDVTNNRVRMVNTSGIITTVAGSSGTGGYGGDGGAATAALLNQPLGVAVDGIGNLFISDQLNHRIRKVDPAGIITTIAGTGAGVYSGDGGPATAAAIRQPFGISLDTTGDMVICDKGNFRVRKISYGNHVPSFLGGVADSFVMCENDTDVSVNAMLGMADADAGQTMTWSIISGPFHGVCTPGFTATSTGGLMVPSGMMYTPATGYSGRDTFKVRIDDGRSIDTIDIYARVKPLPVVAPIAGSSYVCIGTPVTLSNTTPGGVWTASNSTATISATGVVNGITYGTDTITYAVSLAGCPGAVSKVLDIFPMTDSVYGLPAVCIGLSVLWTGIPAGGTWSSATGRASVSGGLVSGVTPGFDTITYTATTPCGTTSYQKPIIINDMVAPAVVINAYPSPFINPGHPVTLVASVIGSGTILFDYQWQLNGTDIPGATDSTYTSSSFADADSVTCIVTNGPCSASSFGWIYIVHVYAGVNSYTGPNNNVLVLPNPNKGSFKVTGIEEDKDVIATLADVTGRIVYMHKLPVSNGTVTISEGVGDAWAPGMYLLRISGSSGQMAARIVVEE